MFEADISAGINWQQSTRSAYTRPPRLFSRRRRLLLSVCFSTRRAVPPPVFAEEI